MPNTQLRREFNEHLREAFLTFESMEEQIVKHEHPKLHAQALEIFGSWRRALRENGINKHRTIENKRFYLYSIMKRRYEKYGEEALRPKNIDHETKEMIVDVYKTMKKLKAAIISWNRDKIIFELREYMVTGGSFDRIESEKPDLYQHALHYFKDVEALEETYETDFQVKEIKVYDEKTPVFSENKKSNKQTTNSRKRGRPRKESQEPTVIEEETVFVQPSELSSKEIASIEKKYDDRLAFFFDVAKAYGGFKDIELTEAIQIHEKSKEDILQFILEEGTRARRNGEVLTEETIKEMDEVMYHALKLRFGSLRDAFNEAAKSLMGV